MSVRPFVNPDDHRDEVVARWGEESWTKSSSWWKNLNARGRETFLAEGVALNRAYREAREAGMPISDPAIRALVDRHRVWITVAWGGIEPTTEQFIGLGEMYVADERFARHYGGVEGASFVRDAMVFWTTRADSTL